MPDKKTPPDTAHAECELCVQAGGDVLWRDDKCRVVLVADADYAGYCRVIWHAHVKEMTDLGETERQHCMRVVFAAEKAVREVLNPHKVNLASFGNMTPHVHWHVIARALDDAHFPNPVWGGRQREGAAAMTTESRRRLGRLLADSLARLI